MKTEDIIVQIREGNKSVLVHLFKKLASEARKKIRKNGGNSADADALLRESLVSLWEEAQKGNPSSVTDPVSFVLDSVSAKWIGGQTRSELMHFIADHSSRSSFWSRWPLSIAAFLLFCMLAAAGTWWVIEDNTGFLKEETRPALLPGDNQASRAPLSGSTPAHIQSAKVQTGPATLKSSDHAARNSNTGPASNTTEATSVAVDTLSGNIISFSETEEHPIVVKKDIVLMVRMLSVTNKNIMVTDSLAGNADESSSLAERTAQKLNPQASLPEPDASSSKDMMTVEFWKSPVNYRGYTFRGNRVVLYGLDEPDWVKLLTLNEHIYIDYGQSVFLLEPSDNFQPFARVTDPSVISRLRK